MEKEMEMEKEMVKSSALYQEPNEENIQDFM